MEEKNKTFHRKKTVWAFVLCLAAFLGLTGRLVYLMVYQSSLLYTGGPGASPEGEKHQGQAGENNRCHRNGCSGR